MRVIKKAESLKTQIYNMLKEEILNGDYDETEVLNERRISEELNVSRSPVREALKTLEAEDWVEYVPYKGVAIKKMTENDLKNVFQIRKVLELLAVELAAGKMDDKTLKRLEGCYLQQKAMLVKPEKKLFMEMDITFHSIILNAAENKLLTKMIGDIRDKIRRFGMNAIFRGPNCYVETVEEHGAVLAAIRLQDTELAKTKMQEHMDKTYSRAHAYISS